MTTYVTYIRKFLVSQEEACEDINEENLDRAVSFYLDESQREPSILEVDSSFEKVC